MKLHEYIAAQLMSGTLKHFSRMHSDFLEKSMSAPLNDDKNLNMRSQSIGNASDGKRLGNAGEQGSSVTSGMAAAQPSELRPVVVKQVDHKSLVGSNPGDHRAPALKSDITAFAKNSPAPREQMRGQQNSKFYNENGKSFVSNDSDSDSDAGN